jgi:hypothetical protein
MWYFITTGFFRGELKEISGMKEAARSLKLFAVEHATPKNLRVALVLLTLATLVISAGAPVSSGGGSGG